YYIDLLDHTCIYIYSSLIWTHTYCMNKTIKFVYINQVGWDEMLQNGIIHAAVQETDATLINKLNYKPNNINNLFVFYKKIQHIYERDIFISKKYIRKDPISQADIALAV
ncbi:hypothetical protein ACJX0J_027979, partial [Zea mays]